MNVAFQRNIGSFIRAVTALAAVTVTAGAASEGTPQNGLSIDRNQFEPLCLSAAFLLTATAALAANETAEVTVTYQDSADGVNWDAYDAGPGDSAPTVITKAGTSVVLAKCQLGGARRYVRARATVTLSRAATDTVALTGVAVIAGADELPIRDFVEPTGS